MTISFFFFDVDAAAAAAIFHVESCDAYAYADAVDERCDAWGHML